MQSAIAGREERHPLRREAGQEELPYYPKSVLCGAQGTQREASRLTAQSVSFSLKELVWPTALSQNPLLKRSPGRGAMPSTPKPWPNAVRLYSTD